MSKQVLRRFPKHGVGFIFCKMKKSSRVSPNEHAKRSSIRTLPSRSEGLTSVLAVFCVWRVHTPYVHTFSHSVIMSVAVSKLSDTSWFFFAKPGNKYRRWLISWRTINGVSASHPKHCWPSWHLSAWQGTGSSRMFNNGAAKLHFRSWTIMKALDVAQWPEAPRFGNHDDTLGFRIPDIRPGSLQKLNNFFLVLFAIDSEYFNSVCVFPLIVERTKHGYSNVLRAGPHSIFRQWSGVHYKT